MRRWIGDVGCKEVENIHEAHEVDAHHVKDVTMWFIGGVDFRVLTYDIGEGIFLGQHHSNSKLDLPFLRGIFLQQIEGRVGGRIFLHHKSIGSVNIASNHAFSAMFCTYGKLIRVSTRNMCAYQNSLDTLVCFFVFVSKRNSHGWYKGMKSSSVML